MIRVTLKAEPEMFDAQVRQPGRALLRVLLGHDAPGGRWLDRKKLADRLDDIPVDDLYARLWQGPCLEWLCAAYDNTCAYLGIRISRAQAPATVDHFIAKSHGAWGRVFAYEWSNYRLSALRPNQRKGRAEILDPFEVDDGWFALDLVEGQVKAGLGVSPAIRGRVDATIHALGLNDPLVREERKKFITWWENGMRFADLEKEAPFVAREIARQGLPQRSGGTGW